MVPESPCSSDDKADWKADTKKWRGHTSSSSRDLSPWDDDEYRSHRSLSSHPDRHGFYMRHARRMNSCDDDYEYEDEKARRRDRRSNNSMYYIRLFVFILGNFKEYVLNTESINFPLKKKRFTKLVSSKQSSNLVTTRR